MTDTSAQGQKETLDRILAELKSGDQARRLAAIAELGTIDFSSAAILRQLKLLAVGPNDCVRESALKALDLRTNIFVASKLSTRDEAERELLLAEIDAWQKEGLIEPHRAEVLRRQYDFDARAGMPPQAVAPSVEKPVVNLSESPQFQSEPQKESTPPASPRSFMETLLSESAIKIYLYLGAFFVIAAAAILAALVEAARLPVLLIATTLFAGGAVGLKKRLPQPSFALAVVFSFLILIDANVLPDSLDLSRRANELYWIFVFLLMACLWAFGAWFYESRLFSVASFLSLSLTALHINRALQSFSDGYFLALTAANLIGLLAVHLLKRWKGQAFALPVFLLAHISQIVVLITSFFFIVFNHIDSNMTTGGWVVSALTWTLAASFYVASDIVVPFLIFPWMAVAALFLLPWLTLSAFDASAPAQIAAFAAWGIVHAAVSEFVQRVKRLEKYHYPFLAWSLPLFLISIAWGLSEETWYGFSAFLIAGIVYTLLNILRPRWYVWMTALMAGLGAYFTFFELPFMERVYVFSGYRFLGAAALLLIPELFFKGKVSLARSWNWPLVGLGTFVAGLNLLTTLTGDTTRYHSSAIIMGAYAILFAAYALRFNSSLLGYFGTASAALSALFAIHYFGRGGWWLPALTALAVVYYAAGFFLARRESLKPWGAMFIHSGLALGVTLTLAAWIWRAYEQSVGWYVFIVAILFIIELYARKNSWLEIFAESLLSIALFRLLDEYTSVDGSIALFSVSLIWIACDLVFKFTLPSRKLDLIVKIVAAALTFFSAASVATELNPGGAAICFGIYALVFAVYAWLHNEPRIGYASTLAFALTVYFGTEAARINAWLFPQIAVAALYYVAGYFLRRAGQAKGWDQTLLFSGLGLGTFIALDSPAQHGGVEKAIPIAIAATFYAAEAFARKNVWLGFPANILYLIAYFVILNELNVDEPQFFTVGAAVLGLFQHYLLRRAAQKPAAFITGLVSQLILLGASYIQMVDSGELKYFLLLFFQALVVLVYGIVVRSRSLIIAPIGFAVLAVVTVLYNALKDLTLVFIIGITGLILLGLGILAVVMRERISSLAERFNDWDA
ncbi:MAG: hypothetical protein HFACDABA_01091 [Anaerolineales bacterium]|nr:hypothetical protein [Anaerolineales bacterium]